MTTQVPDQSTETDVSGTDDLPDIINVVMEMGRPAPPAPSPASRSPAHLAPALANAFPGFDFTTAAIDDFYWRDDARTVLSPSGTRIGDHRAWVERELADLDGDLTAFWTRHRESGSCFSEWRGASVFAFVSTGPGVADFVQLSLGREIEVLAGPVIDSDYRPYSAGALLDPSRVRRDADTVAPVLAGPI
ncbi:hypothetical protein NKJ50_30585 [Mesorhizobium sp. M0115]|uniref:hypothetical protein n=1 Tax=unclassified Mesorhizobium TaxID=325217 RepID=UPI00333CBFA6